MNIRVPIALRLVAAFALLLTSCEGVVFVTLKADSFSVIRFENWAPLTLYNVSNPSDRLLSRVVITARCKERPYMVLEQFYESAPILLEPQSVTPEVGLRQVDGFPYFTSGPVSCSFDASNQAWPTELEVIIRVGE